MARLAALDEVSAALASTMLAKSRQKSIYPTICYPMICVIYQGPPSIPYSQIQLSAGSWRSRSAGYFVTKAARADRLSIPNF